MTAATADYADLMEGLHDAYEGPALDMLSRVRVIVQAAGYYTPLPPCDVSDDDYRWMLRIWPSAAEALWFVNGIDVVLEIVEERAYEDEEGFGVTFGLDITREGGEILGQFQPFNFTEDVWVSALDPSAVMERWQIFASADLSKIPELIS